jgi:hypothetical protein
LISWRGHSYKIDPNTYGLLVEQGIHLVSDEVRKAEIWPKRIPVRSTESVQTVDLISHPLNVIPDHDHLYHAHRTVEYVREANRRGYGADEFGAVSYGIQEWGDRVMKRVGEIEQRQGLATILAHPLCMYLADRFQTLERILGEFGQYRCFWAREIPGLMDAVETMNGE